MDVASLPDDDDGGSGGGGDARLVKMIDGCG